MRISTLVKRKYEENWRETSADLKPIGATDMKMREI